MNTENHKRGYASAAEITDFRLAHHPAVPGSIVVPDHVVARFYSRLVQGAPGECWELRNVLPQRSKTGRAKPYHELKWTGDDGRNYMIGAHRLALLLAQGPIPAGAYATHRCAHSRCVNGLWHIRAGTPAENSRERFAMERTIARTGRKVITLPIRPRAFQCEAVAA